MTIMNPSATRKSAPGARFSTLAMVDPRPALVALESGARIGPATRARSGGVALFRGEPEPPPRRPKRAAFDMAAIALALSVGRFG